MGMASHLTDDERSLFPLKTVPAVVSLFQNILKRTCQPDLALLSVIVGYIENTMTASCAVTPALASDKSPNISEEPASCDTCAIKRETEFCEIELDVVEALYTKFRAVIKSSVDLTVYRQGKYATRELIKRVSDVIWNTLTRSYYKDRAHLQSLYSYLTGNKLDCFGVALAVVAGCQILGYDDVHLALSEDHAWVVFGEDGSTAEVTWHGKGNEDKRGQPVDTGIQARSWLYVAGSPVVCSRYTEVAALVSSINPSVTATVESSLVVALQQSLLWVLYDLGHLSRYPMALGNLADLEEQNPTPGRCHCSQLFSQAIDVARRYYGNSHVYPYTYQGGYFYRSKMYKEALESWANAADTIRSYNYSREDEEIYKEFLEIANELIPYVMKVEGSGHSARSILKDSECFAHLLRFYDGICQWEEGSCTPVLHIGWAKPLVNTISKFDAEVRRHVAIFCSETNDEEGEVKDQNVNESKGTNRPIESGAELDANANQVVLLRPPAWPLETKEEPEERQHQMLTDGGDDDDNDGGERQADGKSNVGVLGSTALAALTDLCGRTVLSPAFFLGSDLQQQTSGDLNISGGAVVGDDVAEDNNQCATTKVTSLPKPKLFLRSHKMAGLKDLLLSEKLNTHAISLQLTAQSQVQLGGRSKPRADDNTAANKDGANKQEGGASRPKRTRKE
nr:EOG090X0424 [Ilyocryptus agilis]